MEEKIELLNKLKTLAERGVGGEKIEAAKLLNKLLKKYKMSEADLRSEEIKEIELTFKNKEEETLLLQVCYKVFVTEEACKDKIYRYRYGKGSRNTKLIKCTPSEAAQIILFYDFYRDLWKEEKRKFLSAFIQKHCLFGSSTGEVKELDNTELADLLSRMRAMSDADTPVLRLESKEEV